MNHAPIRSISFKNFHLSDWQRLKTTLRHFKFLWCYNVICTSRQRICSRRIRFLDVDNSSHLDVCHQSVNLEICAGYFLFGPVLSAVAGGIFKRSIELFTNLHTPCPPRPLPPRGLFSRIAWGHVFWVWFVISYWLCTSWLLSISHEADDPPVNYHSVWSYTRFISSKSPHRIVCGHHICRILGSHLSNIYLLCIRGICKMLFKKYFIF